MKNVFIKVLKDYTVHFFHVIYPNLCYICREETPVRNRNICINCIFDLPYTDHFEYNDNRVTKKFWGRVPIQNGAAFINFYKGSRFTDMIHRFKYEGGRKIGILLGKLAGRRFAKSSWVNDIDVIIPVPIHPRRRAKRGYNQSTEFAKGITEIVNIPIVENLLIKSTYTTSQVDKGRKDRVENVQDTFSTTSREKYIGYHFLLVDDVVTTGSTLESCATELLKIPHSKVSILCLAIARF